MKEHLSSQELQTYQPVSVRALMRVSLVELFTQQHDGKKTQDYDTIMGGQVTFHEALLFNSQYDKELIRLCDQLYMWWKQGKRELIALMVQQYFQGIVKKYSDDPIELENAYEYNTYQEISRFAHDLQQFYEYRGIDSEQSHLFVQYIDGLLIEHSNGTIRSGSMDGYIGLQSLDSGWGQIDIIEDIQDFDAWECTEIDSYFEINAYRIQCLPKDVLEELITYLLEHFPGAYGALKVLHDGMLKVD